MKTISEMRQTLAEKAGSDEAFRRALISDPKAVVARECGVQIPENMNISVLEDSATTAHLILPPNPKLSAEELQRVAGAGNGWGPDNNGEDSDKYW